MSFLFQFALPHGERRNLPASTSSRTCFNSRSRMGSDRPEAHVFCGLDVSIRAPAWGATDAVGGNACLQLFQFALPHGERLRLLVGLASQWRFQFALPHGERLPSCNDRYSLHRKRTIR